MSNDQTYQRPIFTPIILRSQTQLQLSAVKSLVEQTLKINQPQYEWINQEHENIKIETIRQLIANLAFASGGQQTRVIVLLSAELLSLPAQHALLKSLEEPPAQTLLILATNSPASLLTTILSRCQLHHHTSSNDSLDLDTAELEFLNQSNKTYTAIIKFISAYKDRDSAQTLVQKFIYYLSKKQSHQLKLRQNLLQAQDQLSQNLNPSLVLEHCFFETRNQ